MSKMSQIYACVEKFAQKSLKCQKSLDKHLKKKFPPKNFPTRQIRNLIM